MHIFISVLIKNTILSSHKQFLEILELAVGSEKWGDTGLEVAD